jgi:hypothetical protein
MEFARLGRMGPGTRADTVDVVIEDFLNRQIAG